MAQVGGVVIEPAAEERHEEHPRQQHDLATVLGAAGDRTVAGCHGVGNWCVEEGSGEEMNNDSYHARQEPFTFLIIPFREICAVFIYRPDTTKKEEIIHDAIPYAHSRLQAISRI